MEARCSKAEIEQQINSGALDTTEKGSLRQRLRVGERRAQTEEAGQVVLDRRLVVAFLPELPAEPGDQPRRDLVADRHFDVRADVAWLELEDVDPGLVRDRRDDRLREEPGREHARPSN